MEIDYDYLRTGTAIGFRASHELCSNYLFFYLPCIYVCVCVSVFLCNFVLFVFAMGRVA